MKKDGQFQKQLTEFTEELQCELIDILNYWISHTLDFKYSGFVGRIDENNHIDPFAPKGSVLNARILWTFSAAYNFTKNAQYLGIADRAYQYITVHFIDKELGGVFWTVDYQGKPLDTKKQVYAIAFTIYGMAEYYKASGNHEALDTAIGLFRDLVKYAYDKSQYGYFEAFSREWKPVDDLRLSAKDANESKSMNTHLHVLEAYTALYQLWPDPEVRFQLGRLLSDFTDQIVNHETSSLILFFDDHWNRRSDTVSFGHDIEASWLLLETAEALGDKEILKNIRQLSVKMAIGAAKGLDDDGGMWYEIEDGRLVREKHWWVQAEAMVGFINAWQLTAEEKFLRYALQNWKFINSRIKDRKNGEWFWGISENNKTMPAQDKVGLWKCPYHNSRACMEIIKRLTDQL